MPRNVVHAEDQSTKVTATALSTDQHTREYGLSELLWELLTTGKRATQVTLTT